MSEYIVRKDGTRWNVELDSRVVESFSYMADDEANNLVILLNDETAALRQQIADLQAENTKLKADCASYDKVLNDVAIGYLEATEKLKEVEAKESPALAETRVRVNWSGNGFSSGSYKLVSSFSKFGRNWHTIEVITDKVMQYTVNAEKCEIVL